MNEAAIVAMICVGWVACMAVLHDRRRQKVERLQRELRVAAILFAVYGKYPGAAVTDAVRIAFDR